MTTPPNTPDDFVSPTCQPTVERLQQVLDGDLEASAIDTDPHAGACAACRERVAAARLVLSILGTTDPVAVPEGMTDRIVAAVREDRHARIRQRSYGASVGVLAALAASVLVVSWLTQQPREPIVFVEQIEPKPEIAPAPREVAQAKPLRIGDELTKAGIALRETPRAITEPASAAPEVFAKLTEALTRPIEPMPEVEPAGSTLAELPDIARAGLEPLAGTAQKAFSRLMRDVGTVSVKPKS